MTRHSERGAIIIQVAAALLALTLFSAIVLDYGVLWASRGQAQTAADSGALAGAIGLEFVPSDLPAARTAATKAVQANAVWGQTTAAGDMTVSLPIVCPPGPLTAINPGCVKVDVYRGANVNGTAHSNTLPTFFARLAGITSQATNATATAEITAGNAVRCIKPWTVPDKWVDNDEAPIGGWTNNDTFGPPDTYSPSTGFDVNRDSGFELALKPGSTGDFTSGWVQEIDFGCSGSNCYRDEISSCPSWVPTVGLYDGTTPCGASRTDVPSPEHGCIDVKTGVSQGPTVQGIQNLINLDPSATWDASTNSVTGGCQSSQSCVDGDSKSVAISPRIVPIALFNTQTYWNEQNGNTPQGWCAGTGCLAQITNLVGFFIEGMCSDVYATPPTFCGSHPNKVVLGRLMRYPGQMINTGGTSTSSFAKAVVLVR